MDWPETFLTRSKDGLLGWIFWIDDNNAVRDYSNIANSNSDNVNNQSGKFRFEVPTAVTVMIIFWDETAYSYRCRNRRFGVLFRLENEAGANRFLKNVDIYLPDYTASDVRRQQ
jgi:hypothetical protein